MSKSIQVSGLKRTQAVYKTKAKNIGPAVFDWLRDEAKGMVFDGIGDNFSGERSATKKWSPLAPRTIRERAQQGYGPKPILKRSGELLAEATGEGPKIWDLKKGFGFGKLSFTLKSQKAWANQTGEGKLGQNLPARPFMEMNTATRKRLRLSFHSHFKNSNILI